MMDKSGRIDESPSGANVAVLCHNDGTGVSSSTSNNPPIVGSSATISGRHDGLHFQEKISTDSVNDRSQILKSPSDSDESNESGSLPSKSSSTIDSSGSAENGDRLVTKSSNRIKTSKRKKDRSKLRKGKWTLEEEEYTSRIIHYFSTGLLTLPEGATLRSYLADKLNCDPMRITKKYAGASCLGRRVYHFRDRVHPTIAEIQVAKAELDHLEQRFRLRIEGGHPTTATPSIEIPPQAPNTTSGVIPAAVFQNPQNLLQTMLLGLSAIQQHSTSVQQPQSVAPVLSNPILPASFPQPVTTAPAVPAALAQIFLANGASGANPFGTIPSTDPFSVVPQIPGVDPMITNWALSQVAAALGPALSQLATGNVQSLHGPQSQQHQHHQHLQQAQQLQQQQLQAQQQQQLQAQQLQAQNLLAQQKVELQNRIQEQQAIVNQKLFRLLNQETDESKAKSEPNPSQSPEVHIPTPVALGNDDHSKYFAAQFKQAYDRHLNSLGIKVNSSVGRIEANAPSIENEESCQKVQASTSSGSDNVSTEEPPRTEEDKEGGTALLGFLSSLRKSYENVLKDKQMSLGDESMYMPNRPATVTDSNSSQQRDSSVEDSDWNSDKKTDNSSSEDSEKEDSRNVKGKCSNEYHNQGPPRKRMKVKRVADAIRKGPATSKIP